MATTVTAKNVDLSNCDREQIQFPGAILPHGVLLTLREPELTLLQVSQNVTTAFGLDPNQLLGRQLNCLLDQDNVRAIRARLESDPLQGAPTRIITAEVKGKNWNVLAHRHDQVLFLEFEPRSSRSEPSVVDLYSELRGAIAKVQNARSSQEFLDLAVRRIRAFTGFDRVMAYKFLHDGSGWVRSESVIDGQTPYLGQHFPSSDVPAPAKRIFAMSWLRHQPDIGYVPVPMIPEDNPVTGGPLDMSYAVLRSVSVMYTGYLKNMGTSSSMVMTLLKNAQLWGLIACHHHSGPKHVSYEVRTACEFLANMISLLISEKEDLEFSDYRVSLKTTQSALVEAMSKEGEFTEPLTLGTPNLLDFVRAEGAAVIHEGSVFVLGKTPPEDQIESLVEWLSMNVSTEVYSSDCLSSEYPEAALFKETASGLLAIRFAATKRDYLLWFRPELIQTVKWAGNPHKPVDISNDGQRLLPRTSFALWIETVKLKSEPWLDLEIRAAHEFRTAILELVLRQAEQVSELYKSLERSHIELDAFAYVASHDLKEPLRGIHNYSRFLLEDCADQLQAEDVEKLRAMARLTQRMEDLLDSLLHYSRISRNELRRSPCDLNKVLQDVLDMLSLRVSESGAEIRIPRSLPTVEADETSVSEVFSNLISNALKYNDRPHKWVEIGFEERDNAPAVFYVRDNGIGIAPEHLEAIFMIFRRLHGPKEFGGGTGAGLTIARKILERNQGRTWVESSVGEGSTFYFTLGVKEHERKRQPTGKG